MILREYNTGMEFFLKTTAVAHSLLDLDVYTRTIVSSIKERALFLVPAKAIVLNTVCNQTVYK